MCRIGAIKSKSPVHPSEALYLMLPQQKGHDNSGFAMIMTDLFGVFEDYKDKPLISYTGTDSGAKKIADYLLDKGFSLLSHWSPKKNEIEGLDVQKMEHYHFENYDYPAFTKSWTAEQKEELLLDTRLELRALLEEDNQGFIFSFWPDVLTLKEIGNPKDIGTYFNLWEEDDKLKARNIVVQCRQNTNYKIVRYAAHPFFLQGYTLCANGENTFYQKNKECQQNLHRGYIGFESDSQCFLYTLHYVHRQLKWPLTYYKHVITPLPFEDIKKRDDKEELLALRQSLAHLEINGPNTIIGLLPNGNMFTCCDSKKLRPVVVAVTEEKISIASEVCGPNMIMEDRDQSTDLYPNEREIVYIDNDLEVSRWKQ